MAHGYAWEVRGAGGSRWTAAARCAPTCRRERVSVQSISAAGAILAPLVSMDLSKNQVTCMADTIQYGLEPALAESEFIDVLRRSTLAERRPVDQPQTIAAMLRNASLILTARTATGLLVGVARALSDFAFCTYLADLAVDEKFQRQGIGRELIARTHQEAGPQTALVLLAAPKAQSYYPHVGLTQHPSCWFIPPAPRLPG
jgi:GNAT superfamily N-acetyltransferase